MTTSQVETIHGPMNVIDGDIWVSRSLRELGEYSEWEVQFLQMCLRLRGMTRVAIDAGAYIGDLTIPLSRMVDWVYAFEPQGEVREVLESNLALNGIHNVTVIPYCLGNESGLSSYTPCIESPGSTMMCTPEGTHEMNVATLDSFRIKNVDLLKADVEGMEVPLLAGAQETIGSSAPLLFCERDTVFTPGMPSLGEVYETLGYDSNRLSFPMWREGNHRGYKTNTFGETASFMQLGIPRRHKVANAS